MNTGWIKSLSVLAGVLLSASQAAAADQLTVQLSWLPSGDRAHFYLASQSGLFAAEGLDVRIVPGKGAADAIVKVATGAADIGEGGLNAVLTAKAENNVPLKVIMPVHTMMADALITTTSSGVKSLKDLEGKKVATSPFTSSNGAWPFLLRMNNVDPEKVTLIKADAAALTPMLASGKVDAIIQFVNTAPLVMKVLAEAKKEIVVLPWTQYGLDGYATVLFASDRVLATKRDAIARFVKAMQKAILMARDNPAAAAAAVKAAVPETDAAVAEAAFRSTLALMFNDNTQRDGFGRFSPGMVAKTWDWVVKQQGYPSDKIDPMLSIEEIRPAT